MKTGHLNNFIARGYKICTKLFALIFCFIFFTTDSISAENINVAVVHNHGAVRYRNAIPPLVEKLGWKADTYDCEQLPQLMKNLDKYDMIIFATLYNRTGMDFGKFTQGWGKFLHDGGSMVIMDANYPHQTDWVGKINPRLACGKNTGHFNPKIHGKWIDRKHPLMQGTSEESPRGPGWSQIRSWSKYWQPLAKDTTGQTYMAYQEIYDGIVVISTCYTDKMWPTSKFLDNLLRWQYDPVRKRKLKKLKTKINNPTCKIAEIKNIPDIDGKIDKTLLKNMSEISEFSDYGNPEAKPCPITKCWVANGADDLYIVFECKNGREKLFDKKSDSLFTGRDESVEIIVNYSDNPNDSGKYAISLTGKKTGNRYFEAATDIKPDEWIAEIKIPFSSLQNKKGITDLAKCKFNFLRRYHPEKVRNNKILCWVPALNSSDFKKSYGTLKSAAPVQTFPIHPELTVKQPKKLVHGDNHFQIEIQSRIDKPVEVMLGFDSEIASEKKTETISLSPSQNLSLNYLLPLDFTRNTKGRFVVRQKNTNKILATSQFLSLKPEEDSLFTPELIMPAYRDIIQSKDPNKRIVIRGTIENISADSCYIQTQIYNKKQNIPVWQKKKKYSPGDNFNIDVDVSTWKAGKYKIVVELLSSFQNKLLSVKDFGIEILPPAKFEVTFDDRRICHVNGKPFFPIGIYHTSPGMIGWINSVTKRRKLDLPELTIEGVLKDVKDHGFNIAFHSFKMADEKYIQMADKLGLYVIPEIREVPADQFKNMVKLANRYDNVLMWYNMDEPPLNKAQNVLPKLYEVYKTNDPHRPTAAAIAYEECIKYFPGMFDILMLDRYPFNKHSNKNTFSDVGKSMDKGMAVGKYKKPMWMVPQAFAEDQNHLLKPTKEQVRAQGYMCIVHGATGLIWYAYFTGEPYTANPKGRNLWFIPDSDLWPFFKKFNAELSHVTPFILKGKAQGMRKWSSDYIHSASWKYNGKTYLIAVNTSDQNQEVTLKDVKAESIDVLFEDRTVTPSNDVLSDNFKPYERHIYRY